MKMNTGSSKKGFTLVEVIVVAVIVLILAGVAIPMYNGYIRQAKQDTVDNLAETAAAAANSFWRKTGIDPDVGDFEANSGRLKLYYDSRKHEITLVGGLIRVCEAGTNTNRVCSDPDKPYK
jgi:prepilin-type N-terminal cleavage/methylation domain-containing protein